MAPKRKHDGLPAATGRVTRSSSRRTNATAPPAELNQKKRAKTVPAAGKAEAKAPPSPVAELTDGSKTIVIEHCKQCNSFKTRAAAVKEGLEKGVPGVRVLVNPEKPRKGCFEVREGGGGIFVSLLDMKRPFKKMKDLDMDKVVSDIVEKIK